MGASSQIGAFESPCFHSTLTTAYLLQRLLRCLFVHAARANTRFELTRTMQARALQANDRAVPKSDQDALRLGCLFQFIAASLALALR